MTKIIITIITKTALITIILIVKMFLPLYDIFNNYNHHIIPFNTIII